MAISHSLRAMYQMSSNKQIYPVPIRYPTHSKDQLKRLSLCKSMIPTAKALVKVEFPLYALRSQNPKEEEK